MLHSILNKGVDEQMSDEMRRQAKLFNCMALISVSIALFVAVLNTIQHNWLLLTSNIILLSFSAAIFFIKKVKYFYPTLYGLILGLSIYFFLNALLFHNGLHYVLMILIAFSVMAIDNKKGRTLLIIFQSALLVTFVYFQNAPALIKPLPPYRNCIIVSGVLFGFIVVLEYFKTRQLNYRANLSEANEKLRASNNIKERMLSILSHDFNGPVNNLATTLKLFDEGTLTEAQFKNISSKLKTQLEVLTSSLTDVLLWSKMQMAGETGPPVLVNIKQVVQEILPLFQPSFTEKNLTLQNNLDQTANAYAHADDIKLILRNLLSNAVKFSHKGGNIYITTAAFSDKIKVSITDEGTGITPQILAALQNEQLKFASSPGTAKEKGTGLGLMLVQEFLHKNNGTLVVESEAGKGSAFSVILPAKAN